jgi:hypothetical protein
MMVLNFHRRNCAWISEPIKIYGGEQTLFAKCGKGELPPSAPRESIKAKLRSANSTFLLHTYLLEALVITNT